MAAPCQIRPATPADAAAVATIERAAFSDPWSARDFRECMDSGIPFLIAEEQGAVVGYVIARYVQDEAEILNLGVDPARRRHGIGRALVHAMLARLAELRVRHVFLEVRESNAVARRLYAGLGFGEVGRRREYYRLPKEDAMILRATLSAAGGPQ
jgi:ribosomal-protein-alanine N-acetyltransferase